MAVQVITLRQVFDSLFAGKNTVDYAALCALMNINDTFNKDAYSTDDSFSSIEVAKGNYEFTLDTNGEFSGFVLYSRALGAGGKDVWTQVMNPDARIPSSVELYLKKIGTGNKEGYVQVYALRQLNIDNFLINGTKRYRPYYADVAARAAGTLYALCCYQKKLMELHIHDIEVVNKEQMEVNRIMSVISGMKNDLTQSDIGISEINNRNKLQVDADVLAFFATRRLLDQHTQRHDTGLDGDKIASLRKILIGSDTSGQLGKPDRPADIASFIRDHKDDSRLWGNTLDPDIEKLNVALQYLCSAATSEDIRGHFPPCDISDLESDNVDIIHNPATALAVLWTVFYTNSIKPTLRLVGANWELVIENNGTEIRLPSSLFNRQAPQPYTLNDCMLIDSFMSQLCGGGDMYFSYSADGNIWLKADMFSRDNLLALHGAIELLIEARELLQVSETSESEENAEEFDTLISQLEHIVADPNSNLTAIDLFRAMLLQYFDVGYDVETVSSTGDYTLGLINSFKSWVYLHALLKCYQTFMVTKRMAIDSEQDCDVYDPRYWQRASGVATNGRRGMAGIGDHWIFAGDPSIRWFGNNPPSGAEDFETRIAGTLARSYGGIHFIESSLFARNNDNQWVFTENFKTRLQDSGTGFTVYAVKSGGKEYFYVSFLGQGARHGGTEIANLTIAGYDPDNYWEFSESEDVYSDLLIGPTDGERAINAYAKTIKLDGEDCVFWEDSLNLYTSQIGSLSSGRFSTMQMALQASQQSLSMGTNLSKSIARARLEVIGNTR
jgi:hypothetical protein